MLRQDSWTDQDDITFQVENSPDCPNCESSYEDHEARFGETALQGDGVYCRCCDTFVCSLILLSQSVSGRKTAS
ncbi:hypothetical protein AMJ57_05815 [Parcubacteria bacterium SG8_24]|nr:MAG: hypothetical protein AMJ57_05815 [Parcubacteria bacterium SG8_24]